MGNLTVTPSPSHQRSNGRRRRSLREIYNAMRSRSKSKSKGNGDALVSVEEQSEPKMESSKAANILGVPRNVTESADEQKWNIFEATSPTRNKDFFDKLMVDTAASGKGGKKRSKSVGIIGFTFKRNKNKKS